MLPRVFLSQHKAPLLPSPFTQLRHVGHCSRVLVAEELVWHGYPGGVSFVHQDASASKSWICDQGWRGVSVARPTKLFMRSAMVIVS